MSDSRHQPSLRRGAAVRVQQSALGKRAGSPTASVCNKLGERVWHINPALLCARVPARESIQHGQCDGAVDSTRDVSSGPATRGERVACATYPGKMAEEGQRGVVRCIWKSNHDVGPLGIKRVLLADDILDNSRVSQRARVPQLLGLGLA